MYIFFIKQIFYISATIFRSSVAQRMIKNCREIFETLNPVTVGRDILFK